MNTINNNRMQRIFFILLFENIFLTFDIIHSEDGFQFGKDFTETNFSFIYLFCYNMVQHAKIYCG